MATPDGNSRSDFLPEPSGSSLTYGRSGGCFVTRKQGAGIALAVLGCLVAAAALGRYVWAPAMGTPPDGLEELTSASSAGQDVGGRGERLPRGVEPVRYRLHVWPVLDDAPPGRTNFTFQGRLALTVRVVAEDADRISLHAANTLTIADDDILVAEASPTADALADSWDAFPGGTSTSTSDDPEETSPLPPGPLHHLDGGDDTLTRLPVSVVRALPGDLLELHVGAGLAKGGLYTVFFRFNGTLGDTLGGLYRSSYVDHATKSTRWLAASHMQPTYAREVFPCMDEPGLRAPFRVSIAAGNGTSAIANAPLSARTSIAGAPGWQWHHFEDTVPMPTYLVAFAVTDFSYITPKGHRVSARTAPGNDSTEQHEVEVRLWARPSVLQRGRYAVEMAPKLLDYYGEYFSVRYPLPKIDLLAIPDFESGAMENWGLVIFREINLLVDAETDDPAAVEVVAVTVAHELAHQWLGNLVTAAWWDELWLNEGFSSYVQTAAVDHLEPTWKMEVRFLHSVVQPMLLTDASRATRAIAATLRSKNDILQAFDSITYDKGACLLRMLHHSLGDAAFRRGVAQYMKTWQHNSTTESRLWEPLTAAVLEFQGEAPSPAEAPVDGHARLPDNVSVADVMSTWTRQSGHPVVNVTVDRTTGEVLFSQERFLERAWERNSTRPFSGPELWYVPLSMATQTEAAGSAHRLDDTRPRAWLVNRTLSLRLDNATWSPQDWIVVNLHQTGFFRVNYDLENWRLLSEQLRAAPDALPAVVRAQLIGDAFALAGGGLLPLEVALNMTAYLPARERAPIAWATALSSLGSVHGLLIGQPDLVLFERYVQRLLRPMWDLVAPSDPSAVALPGSEANLTHEELHHRADVIGWACLVHVGKCEDWARRSMHLWRLQPDPDNSNSVPVRLRDTAYCTAVAGGSSDVWDFMWERYLAARDGAQGGVDHQMTILKALACSSQPARIAYLLSRALDDGADIRLQDASLVWMTAANNPVGRLVASRFFREHWTRIQKKFGASSLVSTYAVYAATTALSSESDLQDLVAFRAKHNASLGATSRILDSCAEDLLTSMEWREKYLPTARRWMEAALRNPRLFA